MHRRPLYRQRLGLAAPAATGEPDERDKQSSSAQPQTFKPTITLHSSDVASNRLVMHKNLHNEVIPRSGVRTGMGCRIQPPGVS